MGLRWAQLQVPEVGPAQSSAAVPGTECPQSTRSSLSSLLPLRPSPSGPPLHSAYWSLCIPKRTQLGGMTVSLPQRGPAFRSHPARVRGEGLYWVQAAWPWSVLFPVHLLACLSICLSIPTCSSSGPVSLSPHCPSLPAPGGLFAKERGVCLTKKTHIHHIHFLDTTWRFLGHCPDRAPLVPRVACCCG